MNTVIISGLEVLIDKDDSEKITEFGPWCLSCGKEDKDASRFYFKHNLPELNGKRKCVALHRIISGADTGQIVDHINGNTLDCRKENLRVVDTKTNVINARKYNTNRGVTFEHSKKLWRARIQVNGKSVSLGRYKNIDDAKKAYAQAEIEYGYAAIRGGRAS